MALNEKEQFSKPKVRNNRIAFLSIVSMAHHKGHLKDGEKRELQAQMQNLENTL